MSQNWSGDIWSNILWLVILSPSSSDLKDIEIFWYILKYHNIIIRLYWKALNTNNSSKTLWFFLFKKYRQSRMIYAHFHQNPSDTFTCVFCSLFSDTCVAVTGCTRSSGLRLQPLAGSRPLHWIQWAGAAQSMNTTIIIRCIVYRALL